MHESTLPPDADILFLEDNTPWSPRFGDVYFSREDGLAESTHVFLDGNDLEARWRALAPGSVFVVGETGFGTGLNFLLAWRLWERCAPPGAHLVFRSLEAHPLERAALERASTHWPELAPFAARLIALWPPALPGLHVLRCEAGRVTLHLFVGDVLEALGQCADRDAPGADAWFLDGFAPARNPAMWSAAVMHGVAANSRPGASFATFTVAATARDALATAGFALERRPGFGRKREMLRGHLAAAPATVHIPGETPWHAGDGPAPARERAVIVVGAGIAGCCVARALAERGFEVTLLEAGEHAACGASGNPQGMLFTQLPRADSPHGEFTVQSYLFALRFYAALLDNDATARSACGLLQLVEDHGEFRDLEARYAALPGLVRFLDAAAASALAATALAHPALYLPGAGWIAPPRACATLLEHPRITLHTRQRVEALEAGAGWTVHGAGGARFHAATVVLANAQAAAGLLPAAELPLTPVRGQLTLLPADALAQAPATVVCGEGYVTPAHAGRVAAGASFVRGGGDGPPTPAEQHGNLERIAALLPGFDPAAIDRARLRDRVGIRCTTPDRLPLCGPAPDAPALRARFGALRFDARTVIEAPGAFLPGLYLSIGHGSRGLTSAPLCAELLAATIAGEPLPVTRRVRRALSAARFVVRSIVRGRAA